MKIIDTDTTVTATVTAEGDGVPVVILSMTEVRSLRSLLSLIGAKNRLEGESRHSSNDAAVETYQQQRDELEAQVNALLGHYVY